VAGLSWPGVDFDRTHIHIWREISRDEHGAIILSEPKTTQSVRSLDAPEAVLEAFRRHRTEQKRHQLVHADLRSLFYVNVSGRSRQDSSTVWSHTHLAVRGSCRGYVRLALRCRRIHDNSQNHDTHDTPQDDERSCDLTQTRHGGIRRGRETEAGSVRQSKPKQAAGPNFENVRVIACTRTDADQATSSRRVASPSEQNPPRELHQCFPSPHQHTVRRSNPMQTL